MSIFKFWKAVFCLSFLRLYIGGSDSNSSATTTNNYDQRQVNTTNVSTDGGAIQGTIGLASKVVDAASADKVHAYDYADNIFSSAIDFADKNSTRELSAYDRAAAIQTDALHTLQSAYADAKGTNDSQSKVIIGILITVGVVGVAALQRKG